MLGAATAAPHDAGMTTEPPTAARPPTRLHFIDTLRIAAFALLVLYHVGMYYVSWDWHVKSPHAGPVLEPLMRLLSPWRMSLLFLVSGVATGVLLQRPGTTLRGRLKRLLLPLLFGMALVVPPQSWLEVQQKLGWDGGYAEFLGLYASAYDGFCRGDDCLVLPTWNHLWFLPYLAVYTGLAWALVRHARGPQSVLQRGAAWLAVGPWRWLLPVAWLLATRVLLAPHFPTTHALVDDWTMHAQYAPIFLVGVLWAREPSVWADLARKRHVAAVALLLAWVVMLVAEPLLARRLAASVAQWAGVVAALGYARHRLDRPWPWLKPLGEAVFPLYLVHQTITIVAARLLLAPLAWPPLVEGPVLVAITFGGGAAFWLAVRRVPWLRVWCGLSPLQPSRSEVASNAARSVV